MPDDMWILFSNGAQPPAPRSLDELIARTQRLLARFQDLAPADLHRLAKKLDRIADRLDAMADRQERGESEDA